MTTITPAPGLGIPQRGRPPKVGLRDAIVAAAQQVFAERDYHEVRMDEVARASGVGKGTLYRYFPGKRQLYVAVLFESIDHLHDELRREMATPGPPVRRIERGVRCILAHFWDRRLFFSLIHRNEHKPDDIDNREWVRRRSELASLLQSAVEDAIAAGDIIHPTDPHIATELLLGMVRAANRYRRPADSLDAMVSAVVDVFLCGVGTHPATSPAPRDPEKVRT